jgi:uncharacterized membrane protein YhaH (DUF805 family)
MQNLLFSFSGRVNRAKFWLVLIAADIAFLVLFGILCAVTGMSMDVAPDGTPSMVGGGVVGGLIAFLLAVAVIWIGLAMGVKRYHDRNKSGWWVLIALVPVIGGLWYLIEAGFLRGTAGANRYGPDPLAA